MRFFRFLNLLLIVIPILSIGQNFKKDFTKLSYDELKDYYFNPKTPKKDLMNYADAYLLKGKIENKEERISRGFYFKALLYYDIDNKRAIKLLDSVIKYSKNGNDSFFPAAAYCEKGNLLVKGHFFKDALKSFNLGELYSKKNNIDYYYIIRENIAITKSENLGEVDEALKIYKECYKYYKTKDIHDDKYSSDYLSIIFGIADVFKTLKKVDSCSYYNNIGYKDSKATQNKIFLSLFILNEGANQIQKKKYYAAIDSINKALPELKIFNNNINILASYFYYGKAYEGLDKKELAVQNYLKVDSIYQKNKEIITPEFTDGYIYIINYYKNIGDKTNQLKYLITYMTIDSTLQKNYKELDKLLQNDYDIPHLIKDKEQLISSLKNKSQYYFFGIVLLFLATISLLYYNRYNKKRYQKRFKKIIAETLKENDKVQKQEIVINKPTNKEIGIAKEIIEKIVKQLHEFETKKGFLNSKISIQSLSEEFDTNTKYLSRIVNEFKGKTFINYINDLRIDFAINNLKDDNKARKYTLQALANEYGFNSAESFSAAFSKKTGIKPSYFIKELENKNN